MHGSDWMPLLFGQDELSKTEVRLDSVLLSKHPLEKWFIHFASSFYRQNQ